VVITAAAVATTTDMEAEGAMGEVGVGAMTKCQTLEVVCVQ
jgi:hypothetical protein